MSVLPYPDRRRPARRQLDRPRVVAAALRLLDQVGLDALTMRRLADELGVTAASLYRHVRDKDELLVLLADQISSQVPTMAEDVPWQDAFVQAAVAVRRMLLSHRDAARLLASVRPAGVHRLRHIEVVLRRLTQAGFGDREAAWAAYTFNNFVTEFVADEVRVAGEAAAAGCSPRELLAQARAQLRALPAAEFPTLTRLADYVASDDAEAQFAFGLQLWLRGLESLQPARRYFRHQQPS